MDEQASLLGQPTLQNSSRICSASRMLSVSESRCRRLKYMTAMAIWRP